MRRTRGDILRRLWLTGELLGSLYFGESLAFIHRAVCERTGETWCERTTLRDLELLEEMGLVERLHIGPEVRWRWLRNRKSAWLPREAS